LGEKGMRLGVGRKRKQKPMLGLEKN